MIEQVPVGRVAAGAHPVAADELVNEFEPRIVTHVDGHTAVCRERAGGAFGAFAAERGALHRRGRGVHRVDLDHPAEAVRFMGVFRQVETLVETVPVHPLAAGQGGVATRGGIGGCDSGLVGPEIAVEVLFAGQVGAPGRDAHRAVGQGAEHLPARGIRRGLQQGVAGRRAADGHRRATVNSPGVARRENLLPAFRLAFDFDHRHAHRMQRLHDLVACGRFGAVAVELALVGVFVVDHQQRPPTVRSEREEEHAVVVHARLGGLLLGGVRGVRSEGRQVAGDAGRVAPAVQDLELVAGRHPHRILQRSRHRGETQRRPGGRAAGARGGPEQRGDRGCGRFEDQAPFGERWRGS